MSMRFTVLLVVGALITPSVVQAGTEHTLELGGRQRSYWLHLPTPLPKGKLPVVLIFHGGTGTGKGTERLTRFSEVADKEGFIAVYPDGIDKQWYDGRVDNFSRPHKDKIDDVGFIAALLDALAKEHSIDLKRIYATGISNGGIFAHYVGAKLSTRIAAIAPVVGGIAEPFDKEFNPAEPVSVLMMQSTADRFVPYEGGGIGITAKKRGTIISTDRAVAMWGKHNGCDTKPVVKELEDKDPDDGCKVKRYTYGHGKNSSEVVLYKIEGGGHTWPGGLQYAPKKLVGVVCRDIDGSAVIWDFFKKHAKP
jgi:polyhydroxybutyrate depolymerase